MQIDLSGKRAIVTGSTAGIGFAIAAGLAESGATVVINGRSEKSTSAAKERLAKKFPKAKVEGVAADPRYLDISVPPGKRKTFKVEVDRHAFAYIFAGSGAFVSASKPFGVLTEKEIDGQEIKVREQTGNRSLIVFDRGDEVTVQAGEEGVRFLLVSGKPIEEPVAWYGPIVMNTQAELQQAVSELRNGTFIRKQ